MSRHYLSICVPTRFSISRAELCSLRATELFIRRVCLFTVELGGSALHASCHRQRARRRRDCGRAHQGFHARSGPDARWAYQDMQTLMAHCQLAASILCCQKRASFSAQNASVPLIASLSLAQSMITRYLPVSNGNLRVSWSLFEPSKRIERVLPRLLAYAVRQIRQKPVPECGSWARTRRCWQHAAQRL